MPKPRHDLVEQARREGAAAGREYARQRAIDRLHDEALRENEERRIRRGIADVIHNLAKDTPTPVTFVSARQAAESLGMTRHAFLGRVKRKSEGFEHLSLPENRGRRRSFLASAVRRCPVGPDADPEYWAAAADRMQQARREKDRFERERIGT